MSEAPPTSPADSAVRRRRAGIGRVLIAVTVATAMMALFVVYPPLRVATWLVPGWSPGSAAILAVVLLPLAARLAYEVLPGVPTRRLSAVAFTWMGLWFTLTPLILLVDIAALLVPLPAPMTGLVLVAAALAVGVVGVIGATRLHVRHIEIAGGGRAGGRLTQISDVHIGSRFGGLLERIVDRANAEQPDLHLITGDLVDFRDIDVSELAPLGQLNAPTWFVIGNHERYVDCDAICTRLTSLGIHVLRNAAEGHGNFHLLGIDDAEDRDQVARHLPHLSLDPTRFQVLLYHRPDGFDAAAEAGIDLMLTGHTHHGQIWPFNYLVARVFEPMAGLHRRRDTHLYVSPGTGTWGPVLRTASRCEITVFDIV